MIDFLFSAFGCMVILAFWIGAWYVFLTRKDSVSSLDGHRAVVSPLTGNGGGHLSVEKDENQNLADWAQ